MNTEYGTTRPCFSSRRHDALPRPVTTDSFKVTKENGTIIVHYAIVRSSSTSGFHDASMRLPRDPSVHRISKLGQPRSSEQDRVTAPQPSPTRASTSNTMRNMARSCKARGQARSHFGERREDPGHTACVFWHRFPHCIHRALGNWPLK
jgi:hypothetical protein